MQPYNPLDKRNLALSVTNELLRQPLLSLSQPTFEGAGIYALYCVGTNHHFHSISASLNQLRRQFMLVRQFLQVLGLAG